MARTQIPVTKPAGSKVVQPAATPGDPANDHYLENDGLTILQITNTGGAPQTVTIVTAQTVGSPAHDVADDAYSIAAGATEICGPFDPGLYGQPADLNRVHVNITDAAWEFRALSAAR